MAPKKAIPLKKTPTKRKSNVKKIHYYTVGKHDMSEEVKSAYLRITISSVAEFKDEKLDLVEKDVKKFGFEFDKDIHEYNSYHECNIMFTEGMYEYKGSSISLEEFMSKIWDIYVKHHVNVTYFRFTIETKSKIFYHVWQVVRYDSNTTVGIVRDLSQVLKYNYRNEERFNKDVKSGKLKEIKMGDKKRPFLSNMEVCKKGDKKMKDFTEFNGYCMSKKLRDELTVA